MSAKDWDWNECRWVFDGQCRLSKPMDLFPLKVLQLNTGRGVDISNPQSYSTNELDHSESGPCSLPT